MNKHEDLVFYLALCIPIVHIFDYDFTVLVCRVHTEPLRVHVQKRKIITFLIACERMNVSHTHEKVWSAHMKVSHTVQCLICKSVRPRTLFAVQAKQNYHCKQSICRERCIKTADYSTICPFTTLLFTSCLPVDCYNVGSKWNKSQKFLDLKKKKKSISLISALFQCYGNTHTHTHTTYFSHSEILGANGNHMLKY